MLFVRDYAFQILLIRAIKITRKKVVVSSFLELLYLLWVASRDKACFELITFTVSRKQGSLSVDFIAYFTVIQTKTYIVHVPTLPKSICDETTANELFSKSFLGRFWKLFALHFHLATCNVCPLTIPVVNNTGIRFSNSFITFIFTLQTYEITVVYSDGSKSVLLKKYKEFVDLQVSVMMIIPKL